MHIVYWKIDEIHFRKWNWYEIYHENVSFQILLIFHRFSSLCWFCFSHFVFFIYFLFFILTEIMAITIIKFAFVTSSAFYISQFTFYSNGFHLIEYRYRFVLAFVYTDNFISWWQYDTFFILFAATKWLGTRGGTKETKMTTNHLVCKEFLLCNLPCLLRI